MHLTTQITQSNSRITAAASCSEKTSVLPLHLKKVLLENHDFEQDGLTHLSKNLTRLLDASGDCV